MRRQTAIYNEGTGMQSATVSNDISVLINGEQRNVRAGQSVSQLLAWLELPSDRIAVELDRALVRKRDWDHTLISPGARMEIVEFVGGG